MAIRVTADDVQADAAPPTDEPLVLEECAVVRWRGYTRSTFVACLADGTPVAESASFKWRDGAPAHEGAPGEALTALCRELETLGWTHTGDGGEWYEVRYGRWVSAPEPEPEDDLVEDEPGEDAPVARELPPPLPVHIVREPEPQPLPSPAPVAPAPAPAPALHAAPPAGEPAAPRRRRTIALVSLLGILVAVGLGAYIATRAHAAPTRTVQLVSLAPKTQTPAPARKASIAKAAAAPAAAAKPAAPRPMRLVVANTGHASWLEVRRGSSAGPVLYSGTLEPGRTIGYSGTTLWVRFAAAANFRISVDGRPVALQGTVDRVFSSKR